MLAIDITDEDLFINIVFMLFIKHLMEKWRVVAKIYLGHPFLQILNLALFSFG